MVEEPGMCGSSLDGNREIPRPASRKEANRDIAFRVEGLGRTHTAKNLVLRRRAVAATRPRSSGRSRTSQFGEDGIIE